MNTIKNLSHKTAAFTVNVENKTHDAILTEIKAAGFTLGAKSLTALMNGTKTEAADFMVMVDAAPGTTTQPDASVEAAKLAASQAPVISTKAPKAPKVKTLTPEQAKLVADTNAAIPDAAPGATNNRMKTDWEAPGPNQLSQVPVAVRRDSVHHRVFVALCRPEGMTKDELMSEFGWSAGGLAGWIHWEPKAKGYFLNRLKRADGKMAYFIEFKNSGGRRVLPADVLVKDKVVPAPKEPKAAAPAPTAPAAPKQPKIKTPAADAPTMAGAAITSRRRSAPKAQPQA